MKLFERLTLTVLAATALGVVSAMPAPAADNDTAIRPFRVKVPEADLAELRRRIVATKWPEQEPVPDASQGVQRATMQKLARYWATDYDWRKVEARLNSLPQFTTQDRRAGHPFHPRPFQASQCDAARRHARVARLDRRAAEDRRSADEPRPHTGGALRTRLTS
jgi:hypothetical protein